MDYVKFLHMLLFIKLLLKMVPIEYYNYNLQLFIPIEFTFLMFSNSFYKKYIICDS